MLECFQSLASATAIGGYYNKPLVVLSYIVAVFASYVALDLTGRLREEKDPTVQIYWLLGGAFAMGAGIWSMHFVGMLAFIMPMVMTYEPSLTALSLIVAILASGMAMYILKDKNRATAILIIGGIILGLAIASMHYIGMTAMEGVKITYRPSLFILSIIVAIVASEAAVWLIIESGKGSLSYQLKLKLCSALVMGAAICGMHYIGMAAAIFVPLDCKVPAGYSTLDPTILAIGIAVMTMLIMTVAIITSTYRQLLNSALEKEREFLKALLQNLADGIVACDSNFKLTVSNPAAYKLHGLDEKRTLSKIREKFNYFFPDKKTQIPPENLPLKQAYDGKTVKEMDIVIPANKTSAEMRYIKVDGQAIVNSQGQKLGAVIAMHDVTEQKRLEQQLIDQATHDTLTKLPNRTVLYDRIHQAIAFAKRDKRVVSVLFIDLDRFKIINDSLGHDIGDLLLIEVANRLLSCLRESDTIARIGGDEFVVVLGAQNNEDESILIAERIIYAIDAPFYIKGNDLLTTVSVGIAVYPRDGEDSETLVRNADTAMYTAKHKGGNNFVYYTQEMNSRASQRMILEKNLRQAIEKHEFVLYYQPIIDMESGTIISAEALIRWNSPEMGLIAPAEFIPLAEDTNLIVPIGEWVLRTACAQAKAWQDKHLPSIHISVNLSPVQFKNQNIVELLKEILHETGFEAQYLDLEITEGVILDNTEAIMKTLKDLKAMGVHIVMDDFGTGYSSLSYLKKFPVDKLKIDKSFISDLGKNNNDSAIVLSVLAMASSLKMRVVAEGAETKNQLGFLRFHRCDEIQGFYFSYPLPAEEFEKLLREKSDFSKKIPPREEK